MIKKGLLALTFLAIWCPLHAQVWQWSVVVDSVLSGETKGHPRAYLWIPENCRQVRAVVFAQHNMIEEGMLEHSLFRKTMSELNIAEVWVTPGINISFDFTKDADEDFIYMMKLLANVSGYKELEYAPIVPLGHSAYATFPWNFAAWNPQRTLALVSVHGDSPQTNLTGYGGANVNWGNKNIDGVPALFIMGEHEWWEDRILPGFEFVEKHPKSVITFFCDAGHGHFDYSDEMITYVCLFIKKAAQKRLPGKMSINKSNVLINIKPEQGWLIDRWRKDSLPIEAATPYTLYKRDKKFSSWVFDKEMADATEKFYAAARGKQQQYIGVKQNGEILLPGNSHVGVSLKFTPMTNGISFALNVFFADTSRIKPAKDFAKTPLIISRICGPVKKISDTTFQISFKRLGFNNTKRSFDIWLLANNIGDEKFKSAVQQLHMNLPYPNNEGVEQFIQFDSIPNQTSTVKSFRLNAVSSAGLPVSFYVREGHAYVEYNTLRFTKLPPRTKFPIKITVVGWQYGINGKIQSAKPAERTFYITKK